MSKNLDRPPSSMVISAHHVLCESQGCSLKTEFRNGMPPLFLFRLQVTYPNPSDALSTRPQCLMFGRPCFMVANWQYGQRTHSTLEWSSRTADILGKPVCSGHDRSCLMLCLQEVNWRKDHKERHDLVRVGVIELTYHYLFVRYYERR